jgi:hypothetical protein
MLEQTSLKVPQRPELPIYFFLEPESASLWALQCWPFLFKLTEEEEGIKTNKLIE